VPNRSADEYQELLLKARALLAASGSRVQPHSALGRTAPARAVRLRVERRNANC
jgi:hypothetical protein